MAFQLNIPDSVAQSMRLPADEVLPRLRMELAAALYARGILSLGKASEFAEMSRVVAIKIAPFNRYQTLDVLRAVADSGRAADIALYTGNDDNIVADLVTPFRLGGAGSRPLRIAGGLLGHWAVWTLRAVRMLEQIHAEARAERPLAPSWLALGAEITDANAALFDPANQFRGSIAGIHEVLRRQGLLAGRWCLAPGEDLSPGQEAEIDRVCRAYPHLNDDAFVREHLDQWLR